MLLRIRHVTKVYRKGIRANDDVTLEVDAGEVVGLFGHNGAGKTTLLHQVVGLVRPTSGTIHIGGSDAVGDPATARRLCSLQPQSQAPLDGVTPRQAIEAMARIRGAGRRRARQRTAELLAGLDLEEWANTVGEKLSGGVRRLTAFGMAAAEPGNVVILDEPTNDVDPVRRRLLWRQIRALADDGCAVLLVTHNVVEAERGVERLAVLHHGRVVAEGTPAQLRGRHGDRLRLELVAVDDATARRLTDQLTDGAPVTSRAAGTVGTARAAGTAGTAVSEQRAGPALADPPLRTGRRVVVPIEAVAATEALAWAQRERSLGRLDEFSVTPVSLEDVYIGLVGPTEEVDHEARAA